MSVTVKEETKDENENENNGNVAADVVVGEAAVGEVVSTPYGDGRVVAFRDEDSMYEVRLASTSNTATDGSVVTTTGEDGNAIATLFTKYIKILTKPAEAKDDDRRTRETVELNAAYGSFEKLRRLNFELKCFEAGIQHVDHELCTTCVFTRPELQRGGGDGSEEISRFPRLQNFVDKANATITEVTESVTAAAAATTTSTSSNRDVISNDSTKSRFPRLQKFVDKASTTITEATASATANISNSDQNDNITEAAAGTTRTTKSRFPRLQKLVDTASSSISEGTTTTTATTATSASDAAGSKRFPRLQGVWGSANATPSSTTASADAESSITNQGAAPVAGNENSADAGNKQREGPSFASAHKNEAMAALINGNKEESTSFPRLKSLWGSASTMTSGITSKTGDDDNDKQEASKQPGTMKKVVLPRIQKLLNDREKASISPCLVCASPTCPSHASTGFRREGITLCSSCERFFELDFIIDCVSTPDAKERETHINHMIDLYDRCMLLLRYSAQYIDTVATVLEQKKSTQNKINIGSSSVGMVSGVLGVAAAATILTPAGPPLLVASLVFGGGATVVQTGTEAVNYFSEPNKLADRIIALHGMIHSLLRVTGTLRDAMLRDHIRIEAYAAEDETNLGEQVKKVVENNKASVLGAANMGRGLTLGGVAGGTAAAEAGVGFAAGGTVAAEAGVVGARGATAVSRAGTAAARTMRFARFAGGALSAAVLVMEANAIQSTLKSIHAGNPCEKATAIRSIGKEIAEGQLPTTVDLDEECQAYLSALEDRRYPESAATADGESSSVAASTPTVTAIPIEIVSTTTVQSAPVAAAVLLPAITSDTPSSNVDNTLCPPGATIVDGEEEETQQEGVPSAAASTSQAASSPPAAAPSSPTRSPNRLLGSSSHMGGSSLLERIQMHKRRQQELREEQRQQRRQNHDSQRTTSISSLQLNEVQDNQLRDNDLTNLVV